MGKSKKDEEAKSKPGQAQVKEEPEKEEQESEEAVQTTEETELDKVKKELEAKTDAYLRLAAEYDNFRKRTQNEKLAMYDDATAKTLLQILPVADSLDMAVQNSQGAPEQFIKGLDLVRNQLSASLEKLGVECFGEVSDEFDPNIHNAISKIDSEDFGENTISQVFQKGYKIKDRIIRHAMVQVANCG